jgi:hypothetical protein
MAKEIRIGDTVELIRNKVIPFKNSSSCGAIKTGFRGAILTLGAGLTGEVVDFVEDQIFEDQLSVAFTVTELVAFTLVVNKDEVNKISE